MKKYTFLMAVLVIPLVIVSLTLLKPGKVDSQAVNFKFKLDATEGAVSELYWPLTTKSENKNKRWTQNTKSDKHNNSDKYAQDWEMRIGSKKYACSDEILSPISGKVLFSGFSDQEPPYGQQVILKSNINPNFALRLAHLESTSTFEPNQIVEVGDPLGKVGYTGTDYCHLHISFYKNLDDYAVFELKTGDYILGEQYAAEFTLNARYVESCPGNLYKSEFFNNAELQDPAAFSACYSEIDFDWGNESPRENIVEKDRFSARFTRLYNFASGKYEISAESSEAVRIYVSDIPVISDWFNSKQSKISETVTVAPGTYPVKVEYSAGNGKSGLKTNIMFLEDGSNPPVVWQIPSQSIQAGETFTSFNLDLYGSDPDIGDELTWNVSGNYQLSVSIGQDNRVTIEVPTNFAGIEHITFTATDKSGNQESSTASFEVIKSCDIYVRHNDVGHFVHAIDHANSNSDLTAICLFESGLYEFGTVHNTTYGNVGLGVISSPIIIEGNGATMRRRTDIPVPGMKFFTISPGGNLSFNNLTLTGGAVLEQEPHSRVFGGGAIYIDGGKLTVKDSTFSNNTNRGQGGGGAIRNNGGTVLIDNVDFIGNKTDLQGSGGAILNYYRGNMSITNSTFQYNFGDNVGGAIYNSGRTLSISNSIIDSNRSKNNGGGIFANYGTINIENTKISNNQVIYTAYGEGGGVFVSNNGNVTVTNSKFEANHAPISGGAVSNIGSATITNSCITRNSKAVTNSSVSTLVAENNWWGASNGPSGYGPGSGDYVGSGVDFDPFLTSEPASCSL